MLYQMYRKDPRLAVVKEGIFDDYGDPENAKKHLDLLNRQHPDLPRDMRPLHEDEEIDNEDTGHVVTDTVPSAETT
jgi:hypothetical protein